MTDQFPAVRSNSAFKQAIVGGYDREEVDEYVASLERRIEELEVDRTPAGAVQRRLEQVGGEVAGILQRAHETAAQLTDGARTEADQLLESARREADELRSSSQREAQELTDNARREADARLGASHRDAAAITARAESRLRELDVDADRVWGERERILADIRLLAQQLGEITDAAVQRFPADEATDHEHDAGSVTAEIGLLPGEATEVEGATQAFDVEELFSGQAPGSELPPGSKGDLRPGDLALHDEDDDEYEYEDDEDEADVTPGPRGDVGEDPELAGD